MESDFRDGFPDGVIFLHVCKMAWSPKYAAGVALLVAGMTDVPTGVATATLLMWLLQYNVAYTKDATYQEDDRTCFPGY